MRKHISILLAALLLCSLVACGVAEDSDSSTSEYIPVESESSSLSNAPTSMTLLTSVIVSDVPVSSYKEDDKQTTSRRGELTQSTTSVTATSSAITTQPVKEQIKEDKPVTYNTAILYNEKHSSYDTQAEAMRQSILATKDTVKAANGGKTYYVSQKGNDKNDGLTPATAWRSANRIGQAAATFRAGDVVLFERGGVYRGAFTLTSGVSYGAYGNGPKPCIYGSPANYAYASLWEKTNKANVWRVKVGTEMGDIGNIVFDHGVKCASGGKMLNSGIKKDFDFYHDVANGYLYLYLSEGNPGSLYDDIEICPHVFPLRGNRNTVDVTIENLCVKYTGAHAISFSTGAKNITIRGCEIGYIGGSMQETRPPVRYGNGVEFVDLCSNITVEKNWVYQCYDAGLTHQSSNNAGFYVDNVTFRNNLVEYCVYNIEYFFHTEKGGYRNHLYEGNVLRFAGYGFGIEYRLGGSDEVVASINGWRGTLPCQNFVIRNNVLDTSYRYLLVAPYNDGAKGPTVTGNTWIQQADTYSAAGLMWDSDNAAQRVKLSASNLTQLKSAVAVMDKAATTVKFE